MASKKTTDGIKKIVSVLVKRNGLEKILEKVYYNKF